MRPDSLSHTLEEFLGGSRHSVVLEDGARIYDLADSRYSISGEFNKCLIHLWSAERNTVRRVLDAEGPQWESATDGTALGADPAVEARNLPEHGPSYTNGAKNDAGSLSTAPAPDAGAEFSRIHNYKVEQHGGSRTLLWAHLCAGMVAAGPDRVRGAWRK
jgi:hypothetical protein